MPEAKHDFVMQGSFYAHRALKRDTELLNTIANKIDKLPHEDIKLLRKWYQFYWNMMERHHQAEDDIMFVEIEKRQNKPSETIEGMEVEHTRLQFLIDEIKRLLGEAERGKNTPEELKMEISKYTGELNQLFLSHIAKEEKYIYEKMTTYFTPAEQRGIENKVKRKAPLNYLSYMIPWIHDSLTEDERKSFDESMPWFAKLLNRFFWREKYHRISTPVRSLA